MTTAPSQVGMILPRASMKRGGLAQALTDQDSGSSERVTGCDLFDLALWDTSGGVIGFGTSATVAVFANLTPSLISARLQAIEEMYQWYAIRRLKIHLIPAVGTGTSGSVAIGISTDPDLSAAFTTPTQQQVLELNPAVLTPLWAMSTLEYVHRGTKLFESYASSELKEQRFQATLFASGTTSSLSSSQIMQIWLEYEIDFYQQVPLLSSVDLERLGKPCPRCWQTVSGSRDPRALLRAQGRKLPDRDDGFVVLRTQESSTGTFQGLPVYQGLEPSPLRRDETKAHSSARSVSSKG